MGTIIQTNLQQLFDAVQRSIAFDYPGLVASVNDTKVIVEGRMSIVPTVEEFIYFGAIAQYEIRMEIPAVYPASEPKVFELAEAFPHTAEFHCNPKGDCCICVFETWRAQAKDKSIGAYLNGPIRNFFLSQYLKKETGVWPFDEWQHGKQGYLDSCAEKLECGSELSEVAYLLKILSRDWPRGHWTCPCGSKKAIRNCCRSRLQTLSAKISPRDARAMRKRLLLLFKK